MRKLLMITALFFAAIYVSIAQNQLKVALKDSAIMDFYVDGKKVDYELARLLDSNKLASVTILNDAASLEKYKAKVGVVWIKSEQTESVKIEKGNTNEGDDVIRLSKIRGDKDPVFVIDGKKVEREEVTKLDPKDIKNISVLKGKDALDQYGAENGAVVITTNLGKKKDKE